MKKFLSSIARVACCFSGLILVTSTYAEAPAKKPRPFPRQVLTYYLHRVRIEDTSPAEYLWVIDCDHQRENVAAKSLGSEKLRNWVIHRGGYTSIVWIPPRDFSLFNKLISEAMKRDPNRFRNLPKSTNLDADRNPEEGIADFQHFCETNHVDFQRAKMQEF